MRCLKQATFIIALLGAIVLAGCGGSNNSTGQSNYNCGSGDQPYKPTTHLKHRSLVTNYYAGNMEVVDATKDQLTSFSFAVGSQPTYMQLSPDGTLTFTNNTGSNSISSFNNFQEAVKATILLGGWTQSFVTSTSNQFGFAAVYNLSNGNPPNAPGGIVRFNPTDGSVNTYDIPFPYVRYLAMDTAEKHLLAFTDVEDSAHWVDLTTADPKTQAPPYYTLTLTNASGTAVALSRPVAAFFSADNSKAYVLSCGTTCGGSSPASVTEIDLTTIAPPASPSSGLVAIPAKVLNQWQQVNGKQIGAQIGLIDLTANKLYVAGSTLTSTAIDCPFPQLATCTTASGGGGNVQDGYFTVIDLTANTASAPIRIGNGVKRWIQNVNGVYWVASLDCGVQSCVSLVKPTAATASTLATANGDATGISYQPNTGQIFTIEGGQLYIYGQAGDAVSSQYNTDIKGQGSDVVYIDASGPCS